MMERSSVQSQNTNETINKRDMVNILSVSQSRQRVFGGRHICLSDRPRQSRNGISCNDWSVMRSIVTIMGTSGWCRASPSMI